MYGYVYKTTNLINGRIYIGQKSGTFTPSYLGSGKILKQAISVYGRTNFKLEVLAFATTFEMLNGLEMKFIYEYRKVFGDRFIYNILDGGEGVRGLHHSDITKQKISIAHKGKPSPLLGKKADPLDVQKRKESINNTLSKMSENERKIKYRRKHNVDVCKCCVCKQRRHEPLNQSLINKCAELARVQGYKNKGRPSKLRGIPRPPEVLEKIRLTKLKIKQGV